MTVHAFLSSKWGRVAVTVIVALTWMSVSSLLILLNKHILSDAGQGFKYPLFLSGLGMFFSSIASFIACKGLKVFEAKQQISLNFYVIRMLPVGLFMALTLAFGNLVYLYLSVAFIQMLKAFTPVITMVMAFVVGVERPSARLVAAVFLIAIGVAVASYAEVRFSALGVLFMFLSEFTEAIRLIMTQILLQGYKFSAIEGLMYMAPACVFWLGVGSYIMEFDQMAEDRALLKMVASPYLYLSAAAMGFMVNLFAYLFIQLGGALALKVLGTVKNAIVVWAGVLLFAETVTGLQLGGYALSIFGFFLYNHMKMKDMMQPDRPHDPQDSIKHSDVEASTETKPLLDKKPRSPRHPNAIQRHGD